MEWEADVNPKRHPTRVSALSADPVPTGIALLSIALSVGATAVVFTAVKSVLIDPLPYAHADELVQLRSELPNMQEQTHGDWAVWNDVHELDRRTRTLESIGVFSNAVFDLGGDSNVTPDALYGVACAGRTVIWQTTMQIRSACRHV